LLRQQLILFGKHGYHVTTIREIAGHADVSVGIRIGKDLHWLRKFVVEAVDANRTLPLFNSKKLALSGPSFGSEVCISSPAASGSILITLAGGLGKDQFC
jgi:hypothetical protein